MTRTVFLRSLMMSDTEPPPQYSMTICKSMSVARTSLRVDSRLCVLANQKRIDVERKQERKTHPEVGPLEVGAVVLDHVGTVTLLHDGDLLDDLLQVCIHRDLLDGQNLSPCHR